MPRQTHRLTARANMTLPPPRTRTSPDAPYSQAMPNDDNVARMPGAKRVRHPYKSPTIALTNFPKLLGYKVCMREQVQSPIGFHKPNPNQNY